MGEVNRNGIGLQKATLIRRRILMLCAFLVPTVIMLSIFVIEGIYPFGDRSFLFSDMWHQYMPFFNEFLHKIKAGEGLAYTYNVGIGTNFLALYVYYLASPLNWLAFLVPQSHLMEFMSYLVVVKLGLCGLTFYCYLKEHFGHAGAAGLFFSCFYALSGFTAAYNWNIMWLDCVVLAPLIILGLERLVKEGRCGLYCVTLGLSILTNYYISIMICIFLVLYFLILLLTEKRSFKIIGNFVLFSLLAGGMAAVLLVPEVLAILETDFGDMDFPQKAESYFSVLDMLARHCMAISTERGLDHWPNIYCGVPAMMLLPMYAVNKEIPARKKFGMLALAGLILLGFSTNILDFIWHGLNYPDSLPARQSFLYIFLILVMCFGAFRQLDKIPKEHILYSYLGVVVFLLFIEKFVEQEHFELGVEWLNLFFVTVYAILLYLYRTRRDTFLREVLISLILFVVIIESGLNTGLTSVGTTSRSSYLNPLPDYAALYETAKERAQKTAETADPENTQDVFFRLEKFSRRTKNDGTLAGFPSASVFSSTLNSSVMDLYSRLGMRHSKVYYCFDGATFFTSALLNVQFMYGEEKKDEGPLYSLITDSNNVSLYEAEAVLPFGYVAPAGYELRGSYSTEGLRLQNEMVYDLGIKDPLFDRENEYRSRETVTINAEESGYYYGILIASGTGKLEASGDVVRSFADLKNGSVLYLGYLEEGESVTLKNGDESDSTQAFSVGIYRMNEEVLMQALEILGREHLVNVSYDTTHISGEIELEKDGRLILSVPYEKGWKVLVDGEIAEPGTFGGALIALDLSAGRHTIEMSYVPYGKYAGLLISGISILLFLMIMLFKSSKGRCRRNNNEETTQDGGNTAAKDSREEQQGSGADSDGDGGVGSYGDESEELREDGRTDSGRIHRTDQTDSGDCVSSVGSGTAF